jgi:hypothetical protein
VFVKEAEDRAWAPEARHGIEEKLTGALPDGSSVSSVSCRSTMCRVETVHADVGHYGEFVRHAFLNPAAQVWTGPGFSMVMGEPGSGKLVTVAFLARPGSNLPPVPAGG